MTGEWDILGVITHLLTFLLTSWDIQVLKHTHTQVLVQVRNLNHPKLGTFFILIVCLMTSRVNNTQIPGGFHTLDGSEIRRSPVDMANIPLFTWFYNFMHPRWCRISEPSTVVLLRGFQTPMYSWKKSTSRVPQVRCAILETREAQAPVFVPIFIFTRLASKHQT